MEQNGGLFMDLQDTPFFKQRVGMRARPLTLDLQYSSVSTIVTNAAQLLHAPWTAPYTVATWQLPAAYSCMANPQQQT
jgi:hypothetical protein